MAKKFGFDLLQDQAWEFVASELDCLRTEAVGDSEIEKLLYLALVYRVRFGATEYTNVFILADADHERRAMELMKNREERRTFLLVRAQAQIGPRRVDFLIHALDWRREEKWRQLIVECDGHEFHERTKEQAARDRSRDRMAVYEGIDCFRFTGSEIWRDPWSCAEEITNWAIG